MAETQKRGLSYLKGRSVLLREAIRESRLAKTRCDRRVEQIEREKLSVKQWIVLGLLVYIAGFLSFVMAGCCTLHGIGEDLQRATSSYVAEK